MQHSGQIDFARILECLARHKVDFVLVGGVAAVLHGADINTFDLDIVQSREPGNLSRLLIALQELDAIYRMQPARRLQPNASHLSSPGHHLLMTRYGPLDVLGTIGNGHAWGELAERSNTRRGWPRKRSSRAAYPSPNPRRGKKLSYRENRLATGAGI